MKIKENAFKLNHFEFKRFFIENNIQYSRPDFSEYYFGYYVNNNLVGVMSYSKDYSLKNGIWKGIEFNNPYKISYIKFLNSYEKYEINLISDTIILLDDVTFVSCLVDIEDDHYTNLFLELRWYNLGYVSGNYNTKNSKLKFVKYLKNEKYYNDKLKFLYLNHDKNMSGVIYMITNTINNKKYIGQTIRAFIQRYYGYKKLYDNSNTNANEYLYGSFLKHGFENFKFEIIDIGNSIDDLNEKEIFYIKKYNTTNRSFGYNIHEGGRNSPLSEETKKKMSESRKGKPKPVGWREKTIPPAGSEEAKKYGRPKTDEEKRRLSEFSPKYWKGKKRDPETNIKTSRTKKARGLKPPNAKMVVMVDSNDRLIKIYESARDCSFDSEYSYDQIYDRLRGKYPNNLPHKFYYLDQYTGEYDLEKDLYYKPRGVDKDVFVYKIKKVVVCDSNNNYIHTSESVVDASKYTGVHRAAIKRRLDGEHRNQGEYNFHYEDDWNNGNLERFIESDVNKPIGVVKYNIITSEVIEEYNSLNEAGIANGVDMGFIRRKCDGKKSRKSANNSKFDDNISFRYK